MTLNKKKTISIFSFSIIAFDSTYLVDNNLDNTIHIEPHSGFKIARWFTQRFPNSDKVRTINLIDSAYVYIIVFAMCV